MKTLTTNPDLMERLSAWAHANPVEAFAGMTLALAAFCYWNALRDCL